ncbi:6-phosphogluconolactonase, partial [Hortaea werneckii]
QNEAFKRHDVFRIAVSGGSLPKTMAKALLAPSNGSPEDKVDFSKWEVFYADERCVPLTHEDSNHKLVKEEWLDKIPQDMPQPKVFPIDEGTLKDAQETADEYEKKLVSVFASRDSVKVPLFDMLLLGCGPDGHTCSLFPDHPLLRETEAWVLAINDSPKPPPKRITLSLPVVQAAAKIGFVATGGGKKDVLKQIFETEEGRNLPCGLVNGGAGEKVSWFCDTAATDGMDEAIALLCRANFHRALWLPETPAHGKLRVTYSTTSNFHNADLAVILFCGPLFGNRWNAVMIDRMSSAHGVRVICVDRPGMGGSTPVRLDVRVNIWLETVPALLKALNVERVSLMCHSIGTIYALNTMYMLRDILDPRHPYVAFVAPWVHNDHSRATLMRLASALPSSWIDSWDTINRFLLDKVMPVFSWSGGAMASMSSAGQPDSGTDDSSGVTVGQKYGVSEEAGKCIEKLVMKYWLSESTIASNEEALLGLKKGKPSAWGVCDDYEAFVQLCAQQEQQRQTANMDRDKLNVQMYFAENDIMIGEGGREYFHKSWKQSGVEELIDVESKILPGTNHDTAILDPKKGALKHIFEQVAKNRKSSVPSP